MRKSPLCCFGYISVVTIGSYLFFFFSFKIVIDHVLCFSSILPILQLNMMFLRADGQALMPTFLGLERLWALWSGQVQEDPNLLCSPGLECLN